MTHDVIAIGLGTVRWRRTSLPYAGGFYEQPAREMQELAFVCDQQNAMIRRHEPKPKKRERNG